MPGVLDQTSVGFNREVGKMAFLQEDLSSNFLNFNNSAFDDFAAKLFSSDDNMDDLNLLSPPPSSNSSPTHDDFDILPDYETPMDLINYLDNKTDVMPGLSLPLSSILGVNECKPEKRPRKVSCSKDPFMGHRPDFKEFTGTDSPLGSGSILNQLRHSLLDDHPSQNLSPQPTSAFSAWNHTPIGDDDEPAFLCGNSVLNSSFSDHEDTLPDTPQSYSGTITGDDSDVDIETIPDTPHSVELCGYSSSDTSEISSSLSPLSSNHKVSILQRYSSHLNTSSTKSLIRYNGVSSSASLAENLMSGRSSVSKKRKHHKEKNTTKVHTTINHTTYTHTYYPTGNSVNFHDYAMSPSSCTDYETAQPTVQSTSTKRYKRKPVSTLDLSDKEKQNHHNQLERNRRQKLADLFVDLRDEIPNISNQSKASKVMILNQATTYIGDLQRLHRSQEDILTKELHRKEFLKKQLRMLEHNRK